MPKQILIMSFLSISLFTESLAEPVVKINNLAPTELVQLLVIMNPHLETRQAQGLANIIFEEAGNFNIEPTLMMAIIQVESNFKLGAKSSTGDYSLSQINYKIWNKELKRLNRKPLDFNKLKTNPKYAINRMAEILKIVYDRNKQDPHWFAVYHSSTEKLKTRYAKKVKKQLSKLENYSIAQGELTLHNH